MSMQIRALKTDGWTCDSCAKPAVFQVAFQRFENDTPVSSSIELCRACRSELAKRLGIKRKPAKR